MIELERAAFGWPDAAPVWAGLSLCVQPGEKLVLLGANGGGKSTLLQLLDALVYATAGQYRYDGDVVTAARARRTDWARRFRREVGLLFQHPETMLFNPTVRDEIGYGPRRLGLPDAEARIADWAARLRIAHLLDRPPFLLSGGEKQRLALACVLVMEPKLLLLDEPLAHLDPRTARWLLDWLAQSPATVITSTHQLASAPQLGARALVLADGSLAYDGPLGQALADADLLARADLA
ncbi:energy-coupling factor ABC transporter ATP-binding protein [Pseudorhodoferax sp. Leaf274]|uniref:energy-coupling factor ABC transporter ATP-binding protein n=1 Tax=Pseudorhodoferax sp. Leaf274 TaxID=1736318 RepID=UPI0007036D55|nr:ABC transporter ATP-binding protein [Pseudorhodoferax sp. Leaf274]KQP39749.1 ABC transporter [Pseudorhodoferax sp. Leaf274]